METIKLFGHQVHVRDVNVQVRILVVDRFSGNDVILVPEHLIDPVDRFQLEAAIFRELAVPRIVITFGWINWVVWKNEKNVESLWQLLRDKNLLGPSLSEPFKPLNQGSQAQTGLRAELDQYKKGGPHNSLLKCQRALKIE